MTGASDLRDELRRHALTLPDAHEDTPWEDDRVVKVGKRIFVFLGPDGASSGICVKLSESHEEVLAFPGAEPAGYGLGRSGWVMLRFGAEPPPRDALCRLIEGSFRLVAPKRLVKELDARS
ncbi:MAG TPA: MmcQ/YjbR family DNA-binding protein [Candidatus Dormibacteraeota bacterium]|jgi:predicted DNA-binding protein (MmcQ/YjbR family)|nr:MmcQ/YjbR family DNA-binding protein [Candidatus Dormibacteraeota bacterium]